jgi:hypothetical protein
MTGRTMASLNDTLTLGLILILLFGAVSLYLYTRIQQCEQKLNLVESILLDIKMSAELRDYPAMEEHPPVKQQQQQQQQQPIPLYSGDALSPVAETEPFVEMTEEKELYASALEEAALEETAVLDAEGDVKNVEVVKPTAPKAKANPVVTKLSANYESMTLGELKALAKQRSITGAGSMKRSQILEALRTSEKAADGGVLSALSEQSEPFSDVTE